jgi:predicted Zn finger-like uncharacterized protein
MKIVCDHCATKYSIADEKVRGKLFKIRCKKCSHIIVVQGTSGGAEAAAGQDVGANGAVAAQASASGAAPGAVWHLVIDREQVGPMTAEDVRKRRARGEITGDTYAWREGFGDWQRLSAIAEFADLGGLPAAQASHANGSGSGSAHPADEGRLFASAPVSPSPASSFDQSPAPVAAASQPLFTAPAAAAAAPETGGGGMFGAAAASDASMEVRSMTGQRNENSVLFSLNNLQALAVSAQKEKTGANGGGFGGHERSDGSGLIDIRAMAATTLGGAPAARGTKPGEEELPAWGASAFSPVSAPVMLPVATQGVPKWMVGVMIGMGGLILLVIVMVVMIVRHPVPTVVQPAPQPVAPTAAQPGAAQPNGVPGGPPPTTPVVAATPASPTGADKKPPADDKKPADDKTGDHSHRITLNSSHKHSGQGKVPVPAGAPDEPAAPPMRSGEPIAPKPKAPKKGGDELDDLLNRAIGAGSAPAAAPKHAAAAADDGSSAAAAPKHAAADENLPDSLSRSEIQSGIGRVKGKANACFAQFNVPGVVTVSLSIGPNGHVQTANATGKFAGTPTGDCVAHAAKSASFPRFRGAPVSIDYPFVLSK